MTSRREPVVATQDLDCLDRAKFRFALRAPLGLGVLDAFADCELRISAFSRFSPVAKDLFTIVCPGRFRCDGIVGSDALVVAFEGDAVAWPRATMREVADRLTEAGFGAVEYRRGTELGCAECSARFLKGCRGANLPTTPAKAGPNPRTWT